MFRGLYLGLKQQVHVDTMAAKGCAFLTAEELEAEGLSLDQAVVKRPLSYDDEEALVEALDDAANHYCDEVCELQSDYRVLRLQEVCGAELDEEKAEQIREALEEYCADSCPYENPWNAITLEDLSSDHPSLQEVQEILSEIETEGCDLTAIAGDDPYGEPHCREWCDATWEPSRCMRLLRKVLIRYAEVLRTGTSDPDFQQVFHEFRKHCLPTVKHHLTENKAFVVYGGERPETCRFVLVQENGQAMDLATLYGLSEPVYEENLPPGVRCATRSRVLRDPLSSACSRWAKRDSLFIQRLPYPQKRAR